MEQATLSPIISMLLYVCVFEERNTFFEIVKLLCFKNLPIPDEMKSSRGAESPIRVVDLVFSSGESRK